MKASLLEELIGTSLGHKPDAILEQSYFGWIATYIYTPVQLLNPIQES